MARLLIKNGRVIDPASRSRRRGGRVDRGRRHQGRRRRAWRRRAPRCSTRPGLIVAPGFIDMHVHLREPGFEHAETIESGSRAAAAGGFTSVCPMPNTKPVNDNATVTSYIIEKARRHAVVNVFPIGAITKGSAGEELAAIGSMKQAGAVAISDDGRPVMNARVMRRAMEFARSLGIPVINHCEDLHLSAGGDMHEGCGVGAPGPARNSGLFGRRDGGARHSAGGGHRRALSRGAHFVAALGGDGAFAKSKGLAVTAEATPHHLALADRDMKPYDSNYKMKPPLRGRATSRRCSKASSNGAIDAIATDHAPHPGQREDAGVRELPVRDYGPGNGDRRMRWSSWCIPAKLVSRGWSSCSRSGPARILGHRSRNAGGGRAGRRDDILDRPRVDLRREQVVLQEPQFAVRREDV